MRWSITALPRERVKRRPRMARKLAGEQRFLGTLGFG